MSYEVDRVLALRRLRVRLGSSLDMLAFSLLMREENDVFVQEFKENSLTTCFFRSGGDVTIDERADCVSRNRQGEEGLSNDEDEGDGREASRVEAAIDRVFSPHSSSHLSAPRSSLPLAPMTPLSSNRVHVARVRENSELMDAIHDHFRHWTQQMFRGLISTSVQVRASTLSSSFVNLFGNLELSGKDAIDKDIVFSARIVQLTEEEEESSESCLTASFVLQRATSTGSGISSPVGDMSRSMTSEIYDGLRSQDSIDARLVHSSADMRIFASLEGVYSSPSAPDSEEEHSLALHLSSESSSYKIVTLPMREVSCLSPSALTELFRSFTELTNTILEKFQANLATPLRQVSTLRYSGLEKKRNETRGSLLEELRRSQSKIVQQSLNSDASYHRGSSSRNSMPLELEYDPAKSSRLMNHHVPRKR